MQVVQKHAQRALSLPILAVQFRADRWLLRARSQHNSRLGFGNGHDLPIVPLPNKLLHIGHQRLNLIYQTLLAYASIPSSLHSGVGV